MLGGGQSVKELFDLISLHLMEVHAKAQKTLLIIDEAQYLSADVSGLTKPTSPAEAIDLLRQRLLSFAAQ
jgi:hypothetical protein